MRGRFSGHWTDEIAEISTLPEFQNSTIRILGVQEDPEYNIDTGEWEYPNGEPEPIWEGRARVKAVRWGVFYGGESQSNSKVVSSIRIQTPKNSVGRLLKGTSVVVLSSDDNDDLPGHLFNITSGFQGSAQAARTFEAALDGDFDYETEEP